MGREGSMNTTESNCHPWTNLWSRDSWHDLTYQPDRSASSPSIQKGWQQLAHTSSIGLLKLTASLIPGLDKAVPFSLWKPDNIHSPKVLILLYPLQELFPLQGHLGMRVVFESLTLPFLASEGLSKISFCSAEWQAVKWWPPLPIGKDWGDEHFLVKAQENIQATEGKTWTHFTEISVSLVCYRKVYEHI